MDWSILIALTIVAALAYGYWDHTRQRRHLGKSFAVLAARYRGQATPGNLLLLPQLRFERNGCRYLVAALATHGSDSGESGPFTFVDLELPFDTGREIHVRRSTGGGKRLMDPLGPGGIQRPGTRNSMRPFRSKRATRYSHPLFSNCASAKSCLARGRDASR